MSDEHAVWWEQAVESIAATPEDRSSGGATASALRSAYPSANLDGDTWTRLWDDLRCQAFTRTHVKRERDRARDHTADALTAVADLATALGGLHADWALASDPQRRHDLDAAIQQARTALHAVTALLPGVGDPINNAEF